MAASAVALVSTDGVPILVRRNYDGGVSVGELRLYGLSARDCLKFIRSQPHIWANPGAFR